MDDGILDPIDTRNALALGISMALNAPIPDRSTEYLGCRFFEWIIVNG